MASAHAGLGDATYAAVRAALLDLHELMLTAPAAVAGAYSTLDEAGLTRSAEAGVDRLTEGDPSWAPPRGSDLGAWVLAVASQVRALDETLATTARATYGPVPSPDEWRAGGDGPWVIPRWRPREEGRRTGQPYARRGLVRHRVVPAVVLGRPVRVVTQQTLLGPGGAAPRFGGALFEGLTLRTERVEGGFLVRDVDCADQDDAVRRHVARGLRDGCLGIVWPELTVKPALRDVIEGELRRRVFDPDPRMDLQVVVAGSWHEERDGGVANLAAVLDGYGRTVLRYAKGLPYVDRDLGPEAIVAGTEVPVLVTDETAFAFAICRDFCDLGVDLPYPQLDVDFVLVPSMGDVETMRGHCATAKVVRVRFGTRTFVVQQREHPAAAGDWLGMVLPAPDDPAALPAERLRQEGEWASHAATTSQLRTETKAETS